MKRLLKKSVTIFALLICIVCASAQDFNVSASIDSSFLLIGEQACLSIDVNQTQEDKIQLPLFSDTIITGIELIERLKPDTVKMEDGRMSVKHSFVITSFDTALYYIPPFHVFNAKGDTIDTNPLALTVFTVDVDTTQYEVADIKPIYTPPFDWKTFFLIVFLIILGGALIFFIYWIIRKYVKKKTLFGEKTIEPERPAHEVALEALDRIKEEKRWEKVDAKVYYTELTEVVRLYISKRYDLSAMESTSDEVLSLLKTLKLSTSAFVAIKNLLQLADLVKFAKWVPIYDDYLKSLSDAYLFVNETKVVEEASPEEEKRQENEVKIEEK